MNETTDWFGLVLLVLYLERIGERVLDAWPVPLKGYRYTVPGSRLGRDQRIRSADRLHLHDSRPARVPRERRRGGGHPRARDRPCGEPAQLAEPGDRQVTLSWGGSRRDAGFCHGLPDHAHLLAGVTI